MAVTRASLQHSRSRAIDCNATDVWLFDIAPNRPNMPRRCMTSGPTHQRAQLWSPYGSSIAMRSTAPRDVFMVPVAGNAEVEVLSATPLTRIRRTVDLATRFCTPRRTATWASCLLSVTGSRSCCCRARQRGPRTISPDGRWIAYKSDESGTYEIYVQSFPMASRRFASLCLGVCSRGGGGRELFRILRASSWFRGPSTGTTRSPDPSSPPGDPGGAPLLPPDEGDEIRADLLMYSHDLPTRFSRLAQSTGPRR